MKLRSETLRHGLVSSVTSAKRETESLPVIKAKKPRRSRTSAAPLKIVCTTNCSHADNLYNPICYHHPDKVETNLKDLGEWNASIAPKTEAESNGSISELGVGVKHELLQIGSNLDFNLKPLRILANNSLTNNGESIEVAANIFSPVTKLDLNDNQPPRWDQIYNKIVEMRAKFIAPVDTMGCERIPEQVNPDIRLDPALFRFQLLILLMLSSQTKDEVNYAAILKLNHYFESMGYKGGLCIEGVLATDEKTIDSLISKVGFHNRKAGYMKKSCLILRDNFNSDIPKSIQEIVTLPGVGPKMGYLLLHKAWGINDGIGVDVHMHRLSQMWKWLPVSNNPDSTRKSLQNWLPERLWGEVNPLMVGFGQMVCDPQSPNCDICSLSDGFCSSVRRKIVNQRGSPERLAKLKRARGDLSQLITDIEDLF